MPQEFIPCNEKIVESKNFESLTAYLNFAERFNIPEEKICEILDVWPMPNDPIRGEN
jgi:hypothetical protein